MRVYFTCLARTPFRRIFTGFEQFNPLQLALQLCEKFIEKNPTASKVDALFASSVLLDPEIPNLAREIVIRSKINKNCPGHFVSNYCISSLVSTGLAFSAIKSGQISSAITLGVEVMSSPKLFLSDDTSRKIANLFRARGFLKKVKHLSRFRISDLKILFPSPKEPSTGLSMGESCEVMNDRHRVTRQDQDFFAAESHQKAANALKNGVFAEDIFEISGIKSDNIVRPDTSVEKLALLRPAFRKDGSLTAGNSSALTDGASIGLIASEKFLETENLSPLCEIVDAVFAAVPLEDGLLMAPVVAIHKLLEKCNLAINNIDLFEIHEAFACQTIINLRVLEQGWDKYGVKPTKIPTEKINIYGGSLAYGHPFSATGLRLVLHAARGLQMLNKTYAIVASCAAGGGGAAFLIKNPAHR